MADLGPDEGPTSTPVDLAGVGSGACAPGPLWKRKRRLMPPCSMQSTEHSPSELKSGCIMFNKCCGAFLEFVFQMSYRTGKEDKRIRWTNQDSIRHAVFQSCACVFACASASACESASYSRENRSSTTRKRCAARWCLETLGLKKYGQHMSCSLHWHMVVPPRNDLHQLFQMIDMDRSGEGPQQIRNQQPPPRFQPKSNGSSALCCFL